MAAIPMRVARLSIELASTGVLYFLAVRRMSVASSLISVESRCISLHPYHMGVESTLECAHPVFRDDDGLAHGHSCW
jgi:hypothetical protein